MIGYFSGPCSLFGPLNSKPCLNYIFPPLVEPRDKKYIPQTSFPQSALLVTESGLLPLGFMARALERNKSSCFIHKSRYSCADIKMPISGSYIRGDIGNTQGVPNFTVMRECETSAPNHGD